MATSTPEDSSGLKSVNRSFRILEYLEEREGATVSEIENEFEMASSTVYIHLSTLSDLRYVIKEGGEYQCSLRFLAIGGERRDQLPIYQFAKSEVDDIQESTGEIGNVSLEENGHLVQLYTADSRESIDDGAPAGRHLYLHSTAAGKAILSVLAEEKREEILDERGLPPVTDRTITDRETLGHELDAIRRQGYATNKGEHSPGVCAIAVPIELNDETVAGAISISGPLSRLEQERIDEELTPLLRDKKNIIELRMRNNRQRIV